MYSIDQSWAIAQLEDGGRGAFRAIESEAAKAREPEEIYPLYAALTCWGTEGLGVLVDLSRKSDRVAALTAAITLLSMLADNGAYASARFLHTTDSVLNAINAKIQACDLRHDAKRALRNLMNSVPIDDLAMPIGIAINRAGFLAAGVAKVIVSAVSANWIRYGSGVLDQFESMLDTNASDEPAFQQFFCEYPQLLDPLAVHVWSQPDFHGALEPDFVIRRADDSYLVVEIECPSKQLITKAGQLGSEAVHAEKQAVEYREYLDDRKILIRETFPGYKSADCLAIVGLERSLTEHQRASLHRHNNSLQRVHVAGFDSILERARAVVSNVIESTIPVVTRKRLG